MLCNENHRYYLSVSILWRIKNAYACCLKKFYFADSLGHNFPSYDHGTVLGIGKSYFGISSAFFVSFDNNFAHVNVNVFMFCFLFVVRVVMINVWFYIHYLKIVQNNIPVLIIIVMTVN